MTLDALIAFQIVEVAILWLHDWTPLGPFNDVKRVQAEDSRARLVRVTLIQSLPYSVGLVLTILYRQTGHPAWIWTWLWVSHLLLFAGAIRAWWIPYLIRPEPTRAARYERMFGGTHAFLPVRNGMAPNTLHCLLHASTLGVLLTLAIATWQSK